MGYFQQFELANFLPQNYEYKPFIVHKSGVMYCTVSDIMSSFTSGVFMCDMIESVI